MYRHTKKLRLFALLLLAALLIWQPGAERTFRPAPVRAQSGGPAVNEQVSGGGGHSCALRVDGSILCWGFNVNGQLNVPAPNSGFTQVSAGGTYTCGVKNDGSIICWGINENGQLNIPTPNSDFARVSAGASFTCGLKTDGSIICWGLNIYGPLNPPAANNYDFFDVHTGFNHACGLKTDRSIVCWGGNQKNQLAVPEPNSEFVQVSAGGYSTCALKTDSSLVCWGGNISGQLDIPAPNFGFSQVSVGAFHTCALKPDGSIACWGSNSYGLLMIPAPNSDFVHVSAGFYHSCGLKADGSMICWGENLNNQAPQITLYPSALMFCTYNKPCSQSISADGGIVPGSTYFIDNVSGALPPGITLVAGRTLSGIPSQVGDFTFVLRARDEGGYLGTREYTLTVGKDTPSASLSVINPIVIYTGMPQEAGLAITTSSVPGTLRNVRYNGSAAIPINAEIYTITADFIPADTTYYTALPDVKAGLFVIGKSPLNVSADSISRHIGQPNPPLTYIVSGFVNGEDADSAGITGEPELSTSADASSPIGQYPIAVSAGSLRARNYAFTYTHSLLTVTPWQAFIPQVQVANP